MDYFSADTHFGHTNIIKYCKRPFSSTEEMDNHMIASFNRKVNPNDRLFILGDFAWGHLAPQYLRRLKCKNIWLITGNHDKKPSTQMGFAKVVPYHEEKFQLPGEKRAKLICLFHYPILEWNGSHRGSWHLYGHVHGSRSGAHGMEPDKYRMDIGVDKHNFEPMSLLEIRDLFKQVNWRDPLAGQKRWKPKGMTEEEVEQKL